MSWNYRMCRRKVEDVWMYDIREVYYDTGGATGLAWSAEPQGPYGEDMDWLKADFYMMEQAFMRPILDITDENNPVEVPRLG